MCTFQFSANYDMSTLPTCFISRTVVLHLQQGRVTGSRSLFYLFLTTWQWDFSLKALPTALLMGKQEKHSFRQFKVKTIEKRQFVFELSSELASIYLGLLTFRLQSSPT